MQEADRENYSQRGNVQVTEFPFTVIDQSPGRQTRSENPDASWLGF